MSLAGAAQDVETADAERTAAAAALAERDARLERAAAERAELLAQQMAARLEADRTAAAKDVEVAGLASERDAALEQRDAALADAAAAAARHEAELDELRSAAARSASTEETPSKLQAQCDELGASRAALQEESLQQKLQLKNLEFDLAHKDVAHKKDVEKLQARINDAEVWGLEAPRLVPRLVPPDLSRTMSTSVPLPYCAAAGPVASSCAGPSEQQSAGACRPKSTG